MSVSSKRIDVSDKFLKGWPLKYEYYKNKADLRLPYFYRLLLWRRWRWRISVITCRITVRGYRYRVIGIITGMMVRGAYTSQKER